jgi:hypothetical protein
MYESGIWFEALKKITINFSQELVSVSELETGTFRMRIRSANH